MSRKKKKKQNKAWLPAPGADVSRSPNPEASAPGTPPLFRSGDKVRVKIGTRDPDYPDFPLGGWAGTIRELDLDSQPRLYEVVWSNATLEQIHPVYRQRCERDGLDIESIWLPEDCLEPDAGGPVVLEAPGQLVPRPLRPFEQEDRIRAVLGLTSDDPLPQAGGEQLRRYAEFLREKLSVPFRADIWVQLGPFSGEVRPVTAHRLLEVSEGGTDGNGLLVEITSGDERLVVPLCDLETSESSPNRRPLQDYSYWYCNFGDGSGGAGLLEDEDEEQSTPGSIVKLLLRTCVYGMGFGASLGALLATQSSWALPALVIAGGIAAVLGWMWGSRYGILFGAVNRIRGGPAVGGMLGFLFGAVVGGSLGVFLVGCLGTIPGAIAGNLLGNILARFKIRPWGGLIWGLIGACVGGLVLSYLTDSQAAVSGALTGAVVGGVCTGALFLFVVVVLGLMLSSRE